MTISVTLARDPVDGNFMRSGAAPADMSAALQGQLAKLIQQQSGYSEAGYPIAGHEAADGPQLVATHGQAHDTIVFSPQRCPATAPVKAYDISALRVRMRLNRWGDFDPEAFMYAPTTRLDAIRAQQLVEERDGFGLSQGLGQDAIQPLTLRANQGDCIRISLTNLLDQPTSFHVHGADLILAGSGQPALATNPDAMAMPDETVIYEWFIDANYYDENTHYAHPHGPNQRLQVSHGLFAAVIVEPAGAEYFDQRTGAPLCRSETNGRQLCDASWDAIISPGDGTDFREFAIFYHEIGNEAFNVRDRAGRELPQQDPQTGTYRPASRAINYRSEPFSNRLRQAQTDIGFYRNWQADESLAYSSYAFGDPAGPIPQSYVGDPVKFRLIHGGSETFHVPHLHGGGIQWQRQQDIGKDGAPDHVPINAGLQKQFASSMPSSGNDAQTIGPSETYELEIGCGSGGCQQSVGDFLFHCHVASHYIAGMWHFWRVYNTLQDVVGKTDELEVVAELPDRQGMMSTAVSSDGLIGTTVDFSGRAIEVDRSTLPELVEIQLPPQGQKNDVQDAQVFDWVRDGDVYFNEPESARVWPNFAADAPRQRKPLVFARDTGKLAWPFLRPHLGERPPFAPNHGPSPYLEPFGHADGNGVPAPGTNGAASLCPADAPRRFYKIHAIQVPIRIEDPDVEPDGMLFVLEENEGDVRENPDARIPLAIRANQGDCVDVVLVNELNGVFDEVRTLPNLNKTNIHIHFVQFDVQASDGVTTGAAFEQAPRPIQQDDQTTPLMGPVAAGATRLEVRSPSLFHAGAVVAVGIDQAQDVFETATIAAIDGNELVFSQPLRNAHRAGEGVSAEFVRYRWYVARQNGAIYFHDHVDALVRWGRGLFGGLIAEPRGSTWHDPVTGEEIRSGPMADIRTDREVVPGLLGAFREFVLFFTDRNPRNGRAINLRTESIFILTERADGRQNEVFSTEAHGDPRTPVLWAHAGDPLMFRVLTTGTEEIHSFVVTGHRFRQERFQKKSPMINVFPVGISERFNAYVPAAGGPTRGVGDYLYYDGVERHFERGAWGLLRVLPPGDPSIQSLPPRPDGNSRDADAKIAAGPGDPCPADAPLKTFTFGIATMPVLADFGGGPQLRSVKRYYLERPDGSAPIATNTDPPVVIRANAGDCLELTLNNKSFGLAGIHVEGAYVDPSHAWGGKIGRGSEDVTGPGQSDSYRFFLEGELGILRIRDFASPFRNGELGLYAAVVVEPAGATWHDPLTDRPLEQGIEAIVRLPGGSYFREFVTLFHEQDSQIGRFIMPYDDHVDGDLFVNFRHTPFAPRLQRVGRRNPERQANFFNDALAGPPATNVFTAFVGEAVRFRVASSYSEQPQVFSIEGHEWEMTPELAGSDILSSRILPSAGVINIELKRVGGPAGRPGDYLWLNHRLPYTEAGQWGLLRVLPNEALSDSVPRPAPLQ